MGKYKVILFDLDGTLVNSEEGIIHSLKYSLSYFGSAEHNLSILRKAIGPPLEDSFFKLFHLSAEQVPLAVSMFHQEYQVHGVNMFSVYDGIAKMLSSLYGRHYTLAVATSKPAVFAEQILQTAGLISYFQVIVGSGPDRDLEKSAIVREALRDYPHIDRHSILMVGDTCYDVLGAKANHIASCAVTYGFGMTDELSVLNPDHIIHAPLELLKILS